MADKHTVGHVCAKCGGPLNQINWWTASIRDRYGEAFCCKLCRSCALDAVDRFAAEFQTRGENLSGDITSATDNRMTTSTAWCGWQIISPSCYGCLHSGFRFGGKLVCYCANRTISRGVHGDTCESYFGKVCTMTNNRTTEYTDNL